MAVRFVLNPHDGKATLRHLQVALDRHRLLFAFYARAFFQQYLGPILTPPIKPRAAEIKERFIYLRLDLEETDEVVDRPAEEIFNFRDKLEDALQEQGRLVHQELLAQKRAEVLEELKHIPWHEIVGPSDGTWGTGWKLAQHGGEVLESNARELLRLTASLLGAANTRDWHATRVVEQCQASARATGLIGETWPDVRRVPRDYPQNLARLIKALGDAAIIEESMTSPVPTAEDTKIANPGDSDSPVQSQSRVKMPSDDAIKIYRYRFVTGATQEQIATEMTKNLRRPISQSKVSRSLRAVEKFIKDGGVLPNLAPAARAPVSVDPAVIDMGPNQRGTAKRQRGRAERD